MKLKKESNKDFFRNLVIFREAIQDKVINRFIDEDLKYFLDKFLGVFIYKGKKSFAIKTVDYFFYNFKIFLKVDPFEVMFKIIDNLMPFLLTGLKTHKSRVFYVPIIVKGNKRYVLIMDWIVRFLKDNSNIWGIKKEDVLKSLLDSFYFKGLAMNLKKDQHKKALDNKHNVKRLRKQGKLLRTFEKAEMDKKKKKDDELEISKEPEKTRWRLIIEKNIWKRGYVDWKLRDYKKARDGKGINYKNRLVK